MPFPQEKSWKWFAECLMVVFMIFQKTLFLLIYLLFGFSRQGLCVALAAPELTL